MTPYLKLITEIHSQAPRRRACSSGSLDGLCYYDYYYYYYSGRTGGALELLMFTSVKRRRFKRGGETRTRAPLSLCGAEAEQLSESSLVSTARAQLR